MKEQGEKVSRKTEGVYVCPNCGSTMIKAASMRRGSMSTITGWGTPPVVYCEECQYEGPPIMIDSDKVREFGAELKRVADEGEPEEIIKERAPVKPIFSKEYAPIMRLWVILWVLGIFSMMSFFLLGTLLNFPGWLSLCLLGVGILLQIPLYVIGAYVVLFKPWFGKKP